MDEELEVNDTQDSEEFKYEKYDHKLGEFRLNDESVDSIIAKCNDNNIKAKNLRDKLYHNVMNNYGHKDNEVIKYLIDKLEKETTYMLNFFEIDYTLPALLVNLK